MKIPRLLIACNESSLKCIHYIVSNMFNSKIVQTKNEEFVIPVQRIRSRGTNSFSSACFCDLDAAIVYYGIGRRGGEADSVAWHPIVQSLFLLRNASSPSVGGVLRATLSKGRATFSGVDNLTYRTVKKTAGVHTQVQAGRNTLNP